MPIEMPRTSARQRQLRELQARLARRTRAAHARFLIDDEGSVDDEIDEIVLAEYQAVLCAKYITRSPTYRKREDRWKLLLTDPSLMNDREFLEHFRVSREAFPRLVDMVRDNNMFECAPHRTFRGGPELHMMVLLKHLGSSGNDNTSSKLALFFGIGKGSVDNYVRRTVAAVMKLQETVIIWPNAAERRLIASRMYEKYGFVNCVGMADGTLFPLELKPKLNGEDYFTRKGGYALNEMITCDDVSRIRDIIVGWPGSTHDNRVWTNGRANRDPSLFFSANEYLLGDSAFQASSIMIPAYKKPAHTDLDAHKTYFNTRVAKAGIKTEHCIELLKARFQYLKRVRVLIKSKLDMKQLLRLITCTGILHNLLIEEPVPPDWESEIDIRPLDEDDELNVPVPSNAAEEARRSQLLAFMLETRSQREK